MGFVTMGQMDKTHDLFLDMEANGVMHNCAIFTTLMRKNEISKIFELLHSMDKRNVMPDASIVSIGVRLLVKNEISLNSMPKFKRQKLIR